MDTLLKRQTKVIKKILKSNLTDKEKLEDIEEALSMNYNDLINNIIEQPIPINLDTDIDIPCPRDTIAKIKENTKRLDNEIRKSIYNIVEDIEDIIDKTKSLNIYTNDRYRYLRQKLETVLKVLLNED